MRSVHLYYLIRLPNSLYVPPLMHNSGSLFCMQTYCEHKLILYLYFQSDIMSMIAFGVPFGSVKNQRDEKDILGNWRKGLPFFGFAGRFRFFRENIIKLPIIGLMFLPSMSNTSGMGWLMCEADRQVSAREKQVKEKAPDGEPDFLQQ
jgi:hypothetical protein